MTLIATVLPPREGFGFGRAGAIGMIVRRLAGTAGFTNIVFGGRQDGPTFPHIDFQPVMPSLLSFGSTNLRYAAAVAQALKKRQPSIIEVHNRPEIAVAIAERLPSIPVVSFLHNDPIGMRAATTVAERTALLRCLACVVTPSHFLQARLLAGIDAPPKDPVVLPNCIDLSEFPAGKRKERLVLFAGRIVRDKGPDTFVSAYASAAPYLGDWMAEMIGADRFGDDSPDTPFVQTIRGLADGAGVRMPGYRDHPAVLAAMARAAVVVMPSRWEEPFGLVALEAMASRAALICSDRGALPEVAGDAAIYVDPEDTQGFAAAIRLLCTNEPRRIALAEAGRQRAVLFDTGRVTEQLAGLRRRVLEGGVPSG